MVWSEQVGVSIVVPSDHTSGDGRNYIVIGEDVPAAIADHFTAALVFHNGAWALGDPVAGLNTDPSKSVGNFYPNGFIYWALGITGNGALELVAFYFTVPLPAPSSQYVTYRRTLLSIAPPVGIDNPPVFSIGADPLVDTYNDGSVKVRINGYDSIVGPWARGSFQRTDKTANLNVNSQTNLTAQVNQSFGGLNNWTTYAGTNGAGYTTATPGRYLITAALFTDNSVARYESLTVDTNVGAFGLDASNVNAGYSALTGSVVVDAPNGLSFNYHYLNNASAAGLIRAGSYWSVFYQGAIT